MKLLLINNNYPTSKYPNRGAYVKRIHECLVEAGYDVDLLVLKADYSGSFMKLIRYLEFFWKILTTNYKRYDFLYLNHYTFYSVPLSLKINNNTNIVFHWHGSEVNNPSKLTLSFFKREIRRLLQRPYVYHLTPSRYFKDRITKE